MEGLGWRRGEVVRISVSMFSVASIAEGGGERGRKMRCSLLLPASMPRDTEDCLMLPLRTQCGKQCSEDVTGVVLIVLRSCWLHYTRGKKFFLRLVGCPYLLQCAHRPRCLL